MSELHARLYAALTGQQWIELRPLGEGTPSPPDEPPQRSRRGVVRTLDELRDPLPKDAHAKLHEA
ncbi:MAG: hypothetical protein ACE5JM_13460, partial [Armatimonadota bacterium]